MRLSRLAQTGVLGRRGGDAGVGSLFHRLPTRSSLRITPFPQLPFISLQLLDRDFSCGPGVQSCWLSTHADGTGWCVFQWE